MLHLTKFRFLLLAWALLLKSTWCLAMTLSAPVGGAPIALPQGQFVCADGTGTWLPDASGRRLRPPVDPAQIGKASQVRVASSAAACATSKDSIQFIATGPVPVVDRKSVDLWVDEGRVELRGTGLDGSRLEWETKSEHGSDTCAAPTATGGQQSCSYSISKTLAVDPVGIILRISPAGASPHASVFDAAANPVPGDVLTVTPARLMVSSALTLERHVDLSAGSARLLLTHPEAIASVDCETGRCELDGAGVRVRALSSSVKSISLKLRLTPHVFAHTNEGLTQSVTIPLDVTYCPLRVVSSAPFRDTDDVRVVVRVDARCNATAETIRVISNGNVAPIVDSETIEGDVYLLLGLGRITTDRLTLAATRATSDASLIGMTSVKTVPPPQLRVSLHLDEYGSIDFVPTNRDATVSAIAPGVHDKIVSIPVDGAYSIRSHDGRATIRGDAGGGYVVLRFALRDTSLPGHLDEMDLAHFSDTVQRALREVNTPAPIGDVTSKSPIIEVLCSNAAGHPRRVLPGLDIHIPYSQRDSCRVIIHRERIPANAGEQRLDISIDVTGLGGTTRSDGHLSQRLILRRGNERRIIWLRGVKEQFDRINIGVTHVIDETQYMRAIGERLEVPSGQWTIVVEDTHWRFSATAAIPVSLFRFSSDANGSGTGPLSLNLGVLARFTWVTRDGTEGILALEGGVMGMGLAAVTTRQLNIVTGIGMGVPIGNVGKPSQASINIHAWAAYRLGNEYAPLLTPQGVPDSSGQIISLNHWSFVFGPSVTFGNVGFDI